MNIDFYQSSNDIVYYQELSKKYSIIIRTAPNKNSNDEAPFQHKSWEISEPTSDIDPFNSYGKILPGITQSWIKEDSITKGRLKDIPNLLIAIDSSRSMPDPSSTISYAVLGACVAANSYIANDAYVATYNFSDSGLITDYSRDHRKIFSNLINYQAQGTTFNVDILKKIVKKSRSQSDLMIFSDMAITNRDELLGYLSSIQNMNRITLIYIPRAGSPTFQNIKSSGLNVYCVKKECDIPKVVVGESEMSINGDG